jgi:CheY-like chemotaxis protein
MMRAAIPTSIAIEQQLNIEVPAVMTNPSSLNELMLQLIINARNTLGGKGHMKISIDECRLEQQHCTSCGETFSGHYVQLVVTDDGPAIDLQHAARLFGTDPMQAMDSNNVGGSLAGIHRIVHQLGAHLLVTSNAEEGNAFHVLFPVAGMAAELPATQQNTTEAAQHKRFDSHIMIVDDENSVAGFLGELFNQYGLGNSVFTDPTRALQAFLENPQGYDLVITDQSMPLLTGDELARKMIERRPDLPVILCTGYSESMDEARATDMNIRAFLKKPVQIQELLETVHRLLDAE